MKVYKAYTDWEDFLVTAPDIVSAGVFATHKFEEIIAKERANDVKLNEDHRDKLLAEGKEIPSILKKDLEGEGVDHYRDYSVTKLKLIGDLPSE